MGIVELIIALLIVRLIWVYGGRIWMYGERVIIRHMSNRRAARHEDKREFNRSPYE